MDGDEPRRPPGFDEPHLHWDGPPSRTSLRALRWAAWPQVGWLFLVFVVATRATLGPQVEALMLALAVPAAAVITVVAVLLLRVLREGHSRASRRRAMLALALSSLLLLLAAASGAALGR